MPTTPEQQRSAMLENLPDKTGRSLTQWRKLIESTKLEKHGLIVKFLKTEHSVTHGFANLIAAKVLETEPENDLVATLYQGAKAGLRPLHDKIANFAQSLGTDVEVVPKKSSVSLRRKKQFALITPATKTRIDLGLALKGDAATGRLETYNAMCSHRVRLEDVKDFDAQAKAWMKQAYSRSG